MFKFAMTEWTMDNYFDFRELIRVENVCKASCIKNINATEEEDIDKTEERFDHCLKDCGIGSIELRDLVRKQASVSYLTYARNLEKCQELHKGEPIELISCFNHNTDKIERRYFGYYQNEKTNLINKFL